MKKGFTLMEVLITLGIVGIVAALTLPNVMKQHQKRVLVAQLQRTYNTVSNAIPMYMDEVHAVTMYETPAFNYSRSPDDDTPLVNFVKENFKTAKICTTKTTGGLETCFGKKYVSMNGETGSRDTLSGEVCAILKTGATLCFDRMGHKNDFPYLYIDVNGSEGPNVWGRDAFQLEYSNSGSIAESFNDEVQPNHSAANCEENLYGGGCFNRIVENGWVMDY